MTFTDDDLKWLKDEVFGLIEHAKPIIVDANEFKALLACLKAERVWTQDEEAFGARG